MGLEALVHAATQEQRRLSESTSPVASYPPPSPQRLTMGTSDPPNRAIVPVDVQRPIKKQRLSDPSAAAEERERNFAAHYGVLPRRLSGPGAHAYPVNDNAILGIGGPAECSRAEEEKRRTSLESTGKNSTSDTKELPEQDAHEWLLEHYAGPTPSPSIPPPKHPMARIRAGRPASVQKDRTPAPEIASELEKELEEAAASKPVDDNFDPDVALELVAGSLEEERVSMEVDDELLSLVDDPAPPLQRYPYAAPPPSLRLSKPLTPTIVTVSPSFVVSPAPVSPFQPNPERGSMPPPATITKSAKGAAKGKKSAVARVRISISLSLSSFWNICILQSGTKPKQAAKPRAKAGTKAAKPDTTSPAPVPASSSSRGSKASPMTASAIKKSSATATVPSRSRSTSTMTGLPDADNKADVEKDEVEDNEQEQKEDDKLYCVCKTRYDEDRVMIACDLYVFLSSEILIYADLRCRCDEWYHTQCVDMPDLEVDLVDQFFCPPCIESNPQLNLRTTYKTRCFRGLNHANPSSPEACHKAARGDYSKYCSDECGIQYMKIKIAEFEKGGGDRKKLWETVKHAEKREGVVVCVEDGVKMDEEGACKNDMRNVTRTTKARVQWDVERLNGQLDQVVQEREKLKKELDLVLWRTRLLDFATERSEKVDECAWDQRLCFGYEEYADFGMEALTTYEAKDTEEGEDAMRVDSAGAEEGEWWCRGKKKCERHFG